VERLYIATKNEHKVAEFQQLLPAHFPRLSKLPDGILQSPETGDTFHTNALQKAIFYAQYCDGWVLADDSGLCVDALEGKPGIYSARYAGEGASAEDNNHKLLDELRHVPQGQRGAQFVCAVALWNAQRGVGYVAEGKVSGEILTEARGRNGFGYDPLFFIPSLGRTMAELEGVEKNRISHRGKAVTALIELLNGQFPT
jgi:XTP/dITP diphosphohydrolase